MTTLPAVDPADFTPEAIKKLAPICNECGEAGDVDLVRGSRIYGNRTDLADLWMWRCSCGAYCGSHKGTLRPLGTPAGPETRAARSRAHEAFDPLWRKKARLENLSVNKARSKGYKWLAEQLGIEGKDCHIAMMSMMDANRVVALCSGYRR